jgi:hypothetical protein
MLQRFVKQRVSHISAVYIEQDRVEVVTAHRQWRAWQVDSVDRVAIGEGESVFDCLARLTLRGRGRKNSALLILLPLQFYSFHRAVYPATLKDQLDDALSFDWQENVFHDYETTLHFAGPPVLIEDHLSVPIFYLHRETYEKLHQTLSAGMFRSFAILPSALCYSVFLPDEIGTDSDGVPNHLVARLSGPSQLEVHRFYRGRLLDSSLVGPDTLALRLLREKLRCMEGIEESMPLTIELIEDTDSIERRGETGWVWDSLPVRVEAIRGKIIEHWFEYLLQQEEIRTFEDPLYLKPWKVPRVAWPVLAVAGLYALFALYQVYSIGRMKEHFQRLKKQTVALEAQWKPVEQLQTRIAKFQEDQKTLSKFNLEGYPLLELLTLLTQITPEDTSLNYFSLRKGQVILRGESKSAIKYLPELSRIEGFGDVKFASPVTRNPSSEQERFNVQLQLDMEKLRKTMVALDLDVPSARGDADAALQQTGPEGAESREKPEGDRATEGGEVSEEEVTEDAEEAEVIEDDGSEEGTSEDEGTEVIEATEEDDGGNEEEKGP